MTTETIARQRYNVRNYAKPSTAYAEAASLVYDLLNDIRDGGPVADCREATWIQAEAMATLATRLQELKAQFCGGVK